MNSSILFSLIIIISLLFNFINCQLDPWLFEVWRNSSKGLEFTSDGHYYEWGSQAKSGTWTSNENKNPMEVDFKWSVTVLSQLFYPSIYSRGSHNGRKQLIIVRGSSSSGRPSSFNSGTNEIYEGNYVNETLVGKWENKESGDTIIFSHEGFYESIFSNKKTEGLWNTQGEYRETYIDMKQLYPSSTSSILGLYKVEQVDGKMKLYLVLSGTRPSSFNGAMEFWEYSKQEPEPEPEYDSKLIGDWINKETGKSINFTNEGDYKALIESKTSKGNWNTKKGDKNNEIDLEQTKPDESLFFGIYKVKKVDGWNQLTIQMDENKRPSKFNKKAMEFWEPSYYESIEPEPEPEYDPWLLIPQIWYSEAVGRENTIEYSITFSSDGSLWDVDRIKKIGNPGDWSCDTTKEPMYLNLFWESGKFFPSIYSRGSKKGRKMLTIVRGDSKSGRPSDINSENKINYLGPNVDPGLNGEWINDKNTKEFLNFTHEGFFNSSNSKLPLNGLWITQVSNVKGTINFYEVPGLNTVLGIYKLEIIEGRKKLTLQLSTGTSRPSSFDSNSLIFMELNPKVVPPQDPSIFGLWIVPEYKYPYFNEIKFFQDGSYYSTKFDRYDRKYYGFWNTSVGLDYPMLDMNEIVSNPLYMTTIYKLETVEGWRKLSIQYSYNSNSGRPNIFLNPVEFFEAGKFGQQSVRNESIIGNWINQETGNTFDFTEEGLYYNFSKSENSTKQGFWIGMENTQFTDLDLYENKPLGVKYTCIYKVEIEDDGKRKMTLEVSPDWRRPTDFNMKSLVYWEYEKEEQF